MNQENQCPVCHTLLPQIWMFVMPPCSCPATPVVVQPSYAIDVSDVDSTDLLEYFAKYRRNVLPAEVANTASSANIDDCDGFKR